MSKTDLMQEIKHLRQLMSEKNRKYIGLLEQCKKVTRYWTIQILLYRQKVVKCIKSGGTTRTKHDAAESHHKTLTKCALELQQERVE